MPKRPDIKKVMIIGSGPIIIGQACEFDYSGTQACKALRKLGYEIVLVNSNPATIMTDPGMADVTYIEPLNLETMNEIIEKERPDALLAQPGRPDRVEPDLRAGPIRRPGGIRRQGDRGGSRCHRAGRRPHCLQGDHEPAGHRDAQERHRLQRGGGRTHRRGTGLPGGHPPGLHHGRHGRRPGLQRRRTAHHRQPRHLGAAWWGRSWSRNRSWAGKSWNWRWCGTPRIR